MCDDHGSISYGDHGSCGAYDSYGAYGSYCAYRSYGDNYSYGSKTITNITITTLSSLDIMTLGLSLS